MSKKDITQKHYFDDNVRFADFMNAVCFHGRQVVKPEELETMNTSALKADGQTVLERFCDIVKKQTKDGSMYSVYVLENQETVDYGMLIRVMMEECLLYDRQRKEIIKRNREEMKTKESKEETTVEPLNNGEFLYGFKKTDRLTPIYTTVVYWGDKEWDGAKSLRELMDLPEEDEVLREEILELLPDYRIKVFDLNKETDFSAFQTTLKTVFELCAQKNNGKEMQNYIDTHQKEVDELDYESKFFLATMLGQKKLSEELLRREEKGMEERGMCKAFRDMIEDGREEGRAEGRAEAEATIAALRKELEALRCELAAVKG